MVKVRPGHRRATRSAGVASLPSFCFRTELIVHTVSVFSITKGEREYEVKRLTLLETEG
jgi:hypothetical protein